MGKGGGRGEREWREKETEGTTVNRASAKVARQWLAAPLGGRLSGGSRQNVCTPSSQ